MILPVFCSDAPPWDRELSLKLFLECYAIFLQ